MDPDEIKKQESKDFFEYFKEQITELCQEERTSEDRLKEVLQCVSAFVSNHKRPRIPVEYSFRRDGGDKWNIPEETPERNEFVSLFLKLMEENKSALWKSVLNCLHHGPETFRNVDCEKGVLRFKVEEIKVNGVWIPTPISDETKKKKRKKPPVQTESPSPMRKLRQLSEFISEQTASVSLMNNSHFQFSIIVPATIRSFHCHTCLEKVFQTDPGNRPSKIGRKCSMCGVTMCSKCYSNVRSSDFFKRGGCTVCLGGCFCQLCKSIILPKEPSFVVEYPQARAWFGALDSKEVEFNFECYGWENDVIREKWNKRYADPELRSPKGPIYLMNSAFRDTESWKAYIQTARSGVIPITYQGNTVAKISFEGFRKQ